jgi:hypothetical protein
VFVVAQAADHRSHAAQVGLQGPPLLSHKVMKSAGTSMSRTFEVDKLAESENVTCAAFDGDAALDFDETLDMTEFRFAQRTQYAPLAITSRTARRRVNVCVAA